MVSNKQLQNNPLQDMAEWKYKEEVAYWKSLATGLYYEKKMLENHLRDVYVELIKNKSKLNDTQSNSDINRVENKPEAVNYSTDQNVRGRSDYKTKSKKLKKSTYVEPDEDSIDEPTFDPQEDDPKKVINSSRNKEVKAFEPIPVSNQNRSEEMKELYGTYKSQIAGVETALQLNFEHLCSQLKPNYWPELQLNLDFS